MKNKSVLLAATMAIAASAMSSGTNVETPSANNLGMGSTGYNPTYATNPIYFPKKHTIESYRSQQRAAKKRRKAR